MRDRHESIPKAHQDTFEWIYQTPRDGSTYPWDDFAAWLRNSDQTGLYWITGKAGSGKSTLMKFIYNNPQTYEHLQKWSNGIPLINAGFFFWNSGSAMQMSRMGLLRSLLYQILSRQPQLIKRHFSKRWESYTTFGGGGYHWTWSELKLAFEALISDESFRIALFIDGLDEFDGDKQNLVDLIIAAARLPNVKICAASRPWLIFEDAFENKPSLQLEHLTEKDIKQYVLDKFSQNKRYFQLSSHEPEYALALVNSVVEKASGVFLWVYLAVASLLEGLTNADRISDLQKRLDTLPRDLDRLFQKLLHSLDLIYYTHACQMLQIIFTAIEPLSLRVFSFADEEENSVAIEARIGPMPKADQLNMLEETRRRLKSRCKGLLEVAQFKEKPDRVMFLHRTVKDFIAQPQIAFQIYNGAGETFDANRRLANGYLREFKIERGTQLKAWSSKTFITEPVLSKTDSLKFALKTLQSEHHTVVVQADFMDSLAEVAPAFYDIPGLRSRLSSSMSFLGVLFIHGHNGYIRLKLNPTSERFEHLCSVDASDVLKFILMNRDYKSLKLQKIYIPPDICKMLLEQGADLTWLSYDEFRELDKDLQDTLRPHTRLSIRRRELFRRLFKRSGTYS